MATPSTGSTPGHGASRPYGPRALILALVAAVLLLGVALFLVFDVGGPPSRPEIPPPPAAEEGDVVYVAPGEPDPDRPPPAPLEGAAQQAPDQEPPVGQVRPRWTEPETQAWEAPGVSSEELREEEEVIASEEPVAPPRLVRLDPPRYPPMARQMGREATVELRVTVDSQGRVESVEPVGPRAGWGFDEAAHQAALRAAYEPGRRAGRPVPMTTRLSIRFVLE